jgi:hypothetical protein
MSGSKRVTVDQAAWRDAQAAAARLRDVNRELPGMLDALKRQQDERIRQASAEMQSRQDAVERALAGLSKETGKIEARMDRRLRAKTALLWNQMQESTQDLREENRRALDEQEARLQAEVAAERREREQDFQSLREGIAALRSDRDRALSAAAALVADGRLLHGVINAELPHERFAPSQLAAIEQRLLQAEGNLTGGLGEAALAQAQEIYLQLSALRSQVEFRDQEWRAAQIAAVSAITVLQEQIQVNASLEVANTDGALIDGVMLDVDYWSEGELAELSARVSALAERVGSQAASPALAELRSIVERDAADLDAELTAIVSRAGARQFASQVRVNLAELVVETLENTTGFAWEEGQATYMGEDPRRAFYSKLRHSDDSEIVVEVAPDESGESCVLRILSFDAGIPDEEERLRRMHAIVDQLRDRGLRVGSPAAESALPDPALADLNGLRLAVPGPQRPVARTATSRSTPPERSTG